MATTADTGGEAPRAFPPGAAWRAPLLEVGVFLLAILVFAQYGLHGALQRDDAVLLYAGQQLEEGVPPYRSAATLKGPVAQLVAGLGAVAARAAGRDDVLTVRALFLLLAALTVALVARLGGDVWGSPRAGLFAALAVMGSVGYARLAASGPRYATVMLLFLVLGILLTVRRRWFGAGAAGSLAYLTWQPSALLPLATLALAALEPRRRRPLAAAAAGIALPVAAVSAWAASAGILGELALRIFLFDLPYVERASRGLQEHLAAPVSAVVQGYGAWMAAATLAAAAFFVFEAARSRRASASWSGTLHRSPAAVCLLVFPALLAWSILDFQGYDDFFPLLPFVALGCGALLDRLVEAAGRRAGGSARLGAAAAAAGILLALWAARSGGERGLDAQRRAAREIERRYGATHRLVAIGDPVPLVLLRRANPNPYLFLASGFDSLIDRRTPGGFSAWLEGLRGDRPLVVLGGRMRGGRRDTLARWLAEDFRRERIGPLVIHVESAPR